MNRAQQLHHFAATTQATKKTLHSLEPQSVQPKADPPQAVTGADQRSNTD